MDIYRIVNPLALETESLVAFLRKVFPEDSLAIPGGYDKGKMLRLLKNPDMALFVGVEDGELLGLSLVYAPDALDLSWPQIPHFYNAGSSRLRGALVDASVEFVKSKGHMGVWAINASGAPDSVWARMFRRVGPAEKVGAVMKVEFKE